MFDSDIDLTQEKEDYIDFTDVDSLLQLGESNNNIVFNNGNLLPTISPAQPLNSLPPIQLPHFSSSLSPINSNNNNLLESSIIYAVPIKDNHLYIIHRGSKVYLLQKNIGQVYFNNTAKFNSICWNHKVQRVLANSDELKLLRCNFSSEKQVKKAQLIQKEDLYSMLRNIKKDEIITLVCFLKVIVF
jgi:hypothetical protein